MIFAQLMAQAVTLPAILAEAAQRVPEIVLASGIHIVIGVEGALDGL